MENNNANNDFEALCAGYVLGALNEDDERLFEKMLQEASPEERKIYEEMKLVRDEMALASEPAEPSDQLEERLFTSLSSNQSAENRSQSTQFIPAWAYKAAAALLLVATLSFALLTLNLNETVEEQETQLTELRSELDRQEELLSILSGRQITLINMGGLDPSPDGYGKILWDPDRGQAVLQLANLPAPPAQKDYQLWLIKEGENPISAGVFEFDQPSSDLFFKVERLEEEPSPLSNAFAVTLEPDGGAPQPTGEMYLIGEQE